MLLRLLLIFAALVGGIAVASLAPEVSKTTRAVLGTIPVPGFAQRSAQEPSSKKPKGDHVHNSREADDDHGSDAAEEGALKLSSEQITAAGIETAKAAEGTLAHHISVPGTVVPAADRTARVAAKVVGTVAELKKQLGDPVTKGEVVAVLDSREVAEAKSEFLAAIVNLDLQKTLFGREQTLSERKIIAENQFLRTRNTFMETQLRVDLARQKLLALGLAEKEITGLSRQSTALQQYELRAPAGGRIVERLVQLGAAVGGEGQPKELYGIADLTHVWVELAVSPRELAFVKEGQPVQIAAGGTDQRADGKIVFKSPILNQETRAARVIAEIPNDRMAWQPGAFVTAAILVEEQKAPVVVPTSALQTVGKDTVVFVRTRDGFEKREVVLGRNDGQSVEIVFGLFPGDEIAVGNVFTLKAELGKSEASHAH